MTAIAYIANQFPSPVEPYVTAEIQELRRRGIEVIPCSAHRGYEDLAGDLKQIATETLYLQPVRIWLLLQALWLCFRQLPLLSDFLKRALLGGRETFSQRLRALMHTWLGAYYALLLKEREIQHIHAHHGYFSSWVAMVAAKLLGAGFSFTLHGSDLLLHRAWLDLKLRHCDFCFTISEYNRRHILRNYAHVDPAKIIVQRLGVSVQESKSIGLAKNDRFTLLAVGRLHAVKDHAFLLRACNELISREVPVTCWIAGEGPERSALEQLIAELELYANVHLLGHLSQAQLDVCYHNADLVVSTSQSEGIPLALMDAMGRGKAVLAPRITGIPELVSDGISGFLYEAGSMEDFLRQIESIGLNQNLASIAEAGRRHVGEHFDQCKNVKEFADRFLHEIHCKHPTRNGEATSHAHSLLQQI